MTGQTRMSRSLGSMDACREKVRKPRIDPRLHPERDEIAVETDRLVKGAEFQVAEIAHVAQCEPVLGVQLAEILMLTKQ